MPQLTLGFDDFVGQALEVIGSSVRDGPDQSFEHVGVHVKSPFVPV